MGWVLYQHRQGPQLLGNPPQLLARPPTTTQTPNYQADAQLPGRTPTTRRAPNYQANPQLPDRPPTTQMSLGAPQEHNCCAWCFGSIAGAPLCVVLWVYALGLWSGWSVVRRALLLAQWAVPIGPGPVGRTQWVGPHSAKPNGPGPKGRARGPGPMGRAHWNRPLGPGSLGRPNGPAPMGRAQWAGPKCYGPSPMGPLPSGPTQRACPTPRVAHPLCVVPRVRPWLVGLRNPLPTNGLTPHGLSTCAGGSLSSDSRSWSGRVS